MMKKHVFVFLILLGFAFGCWLVKGNRELLILTGVIERPQDDIHERILDMDRVALGMEMWQVKEVLGPPEERNVSEARQGTKEEQWTYGDKCLYFTNGVLTSRQDGVKH
jgi:hypothetical protein